MNNKPEPAAGRLQAVEDVVKDLAARLEGLERRVEATPATSGRVPGPMTGAGEPPAGPTKLQDVLPDIKDLSAKVGGLEHLSEIVDTLKQSKE